MVKKLFNPSVFFAPSNLRLAKKIKITSPSAFRESIRVLKKGGLSIAERAALTVAQTRAKLQLRRKTLSQKERGEFKQISLIKIPAATKK